MRVMLASELPFQFWAAGVGHRFGRAFAMPSASASALGVNRRSATANALFPAGL